MIPIARNIAHDGTAVQGDGLRAGLALDDLKADAGRQRDITRTGSVDGPTLEGARHLDQSGRRRPAGRRHFERSTLADPRGDRGGAQRAGMADADRTFADFEAGGSGETGGVVAQDQHAVADLTQVEQALIVQPADTGGGAELDTSRRARPEGA